MHPHSYDMKRYITGIITLLLSVTALSAQEGMNLMITGNDTTPALTKRELRKQKVAKRNLHYNILGGPSYTPDFGAVLGGSALMTFRMNPSDTTQLRSVVPVAIAFLFNGGINLFSKPQLFFKGDRFRIFGKFAYKNTEDNFYGLGYSTNKNYVRSDSTSQYRYSGIQFNPWFLFRLGNSNIFAGPQIDINYDDITEPAKHLVDEPSYKAAGGTEKGYKNFNSGLGFLLTYDSRDIPSNAYSGMYLDFRGMMYTKFLGSDENFYRLEIDYRQYKTVGKRKVIAWTDKSTWLKRMLNHVGFVAWTGCGFMGPTPGKIEGVLPNYGVGLRIEVQPRMNVRLDLGKNTVNNQTLFYFNMTEAF